MPRKDLVNQGALAIREAVLPELRPHSMMSQGVTRMCRSVSLPLFRDTPLECECETPTGAAPGPGASHEQIGDTRVDVQS